MLVLRKERWLREFALVAWLLTACSEEVPHAPSWSADLDEIEEKVIVLPGSGPTWSLISWRLSIREIDPDTGQLLASERPLLAEPPDTRLSSGIAIDNHRGYLTTVRLGARSSGDSKLWYFDVRGSSMLVKQSPSAMTVLAASPSGGVWLAEGLAGTAKLVRVDPTHKVEWEVGLGEQVASDCAVGGDDRLACVLHGSQGYAVGVLNDSGSWEWQKSFGILSGATWSGQEIVVGSTEGLIRLDGATGQTICESPTALSPNKGLAGHFGPVQKALAVAIHYVPGGGQLRFAHLTACGTPHFLRTHSTTPAGLVTSQSLTALPDGGWLISASVADEGLGVPQARPWLIRTDPWGRVGDPSPCSITPASRCDDGNPCTLDDCVPNSGCVHWTAYDGTACGSKRTCIAGVCRESAK